MPLTTNNSSSNTVRDSSNNTEERSTPKAPPTVNMSKVCSIILGGGQGSRLFPLTKRTCKPAILFGGRFRLVDIPLSNAINSQIHKNYVVTQFLSTSLHQHIFQTFRPESYSSGFIEILAAEQKPGSSDWFKGTADAIRQNLEYLVETPADYFLILSGDQLYHINFERMMQCALEKDVDVLVATLAVNEKDAKRMGIMKINEDHHIIDFHEKPDTMAALERLKTPTSVLEKMGFSTGAENSFLGSMGIYLFKRSALFALLNEDPREDFGKHLIPSKVKQGSIAAFAHEGYWEDIGTIESFYQANLALTAKYPPFNVYNKQCPIITNRSHLPGAKISNCLLADSIVCDGSIIEANEVTGSVLGQRTVVKSGTVIRNSYVMGNDFYSPPINHSGQLPEQLYIDENCLIQNAIIDRNASIGKGVKLINKNHIKEYDSPHVLIRDGIIVVPRGASVPDGFVI